MLNAFWSWITYNKSISQYFRNTNNNLAIQASLIYPRHCKKIRKMPPPLQLSKTVLFPVAKLASTLFDWQGYHQETCKYFKHIVYTFVLKKIGILLINEKRPQFSNYLSKKKKKRISGNANKRKKTFKRPHTGGVRYLQKIFR